MINNNIIDQTNGKYTEIANFASKHPNGESFRNCLKRLSNLANGYNGATCVIYDDWTPMSLYFNIHDDHHDRLLNGGIIYHGSHDGFGNGSAPTFSVTLNPTDGWQLHT